MKRFFLAALMAALLLALTGLSTPAPAMAQQSPTGIEVSAFTSQTTMEVGDRVVFYLQVGDITVEDGVRSFKINFHFNPAVFRQVGNVGVGGEFPEVDFTREEEPAPGGHITLGGGARNGNGEPILLTNVGTNTLAFVTYEAIDTAEDSDLWAVMNFNEFSLEPEDHVFVDVTDDTDDTLGDVMQDGDLDVFDAELVLRAALDPTRIGLTAEQIRRADVTGNGAVTPDDAVHVLWNVVRGQRCWPVEGCTPTFEAGKRGLEAAYQAAYKGTLGDIVTWDRGGVYVNTLGMTAFQIALPMNGLNASAVDIDGWSIQSSVREDTLHIAGIGPETSGWIRLANIREFTGGTAWLENNQPLPILNVASVAVEGEEVPAEFTLGQNYPNPFNPTTTIRYSLAQAQHTTLVIYDTLGRQVAVLVDSTMPSGQHEVVFSAGNLPSGTYLYRLNTANRVLSQKMTLLK